MALDDKERWELFKSTQNRCAYCGSRLIWDNYQVKGLQGAWLVDDPSEPLPEGRERVQHAAADDGPAPIC